MQSPRGNGTTLMRAQLEFASMVVDTYTQGTKFWWRFGGAFGEPAIEAVEAVAQTQRRYLETLKSALEENESRT